MKTNHYSKYLKHEDILQISCLRWLRLQHPDMIAHHSPNEGKRSPYEQYVFTQMGISGGFPDLMVFSKLKIGFIELKAGDNEPSLSQAEWIERLDCNGYPAIVGWSLTAFRWFVDEYDEKELSFVRSTKSKGGGIYIVWSKDPDLPSAVKGRMLPYVTEND